MGSIKGPQGPFLLTTVNNIMANSKLQNAIQIGARSLLNLDYLLTQLPAFFAAKGNAVPAIYQLQIRIILNSQRVLLTNIKSAAASQKISPTVSRKFVTRQIWFRDLCTVKNDLLAAISLLQASGVNVNRAVAQKQIDQFIVRYVMPYLP